MKKNIITVLLSIFGLNLIYGQQSYEKSLLQQVTPIEPTSTSLGKYGLFPICSSNGLIPINISLYEIKSGDLSQTIQLSYHGGGISVDEESSWVGLGWSLKYGGLITRAMYGFPDEEETSTVPDEERIRKDIESGVFEETYYKNWANPSSGAYSFKPDIYYYDFANNSGSFCVNRKENRSLLFMPYSTLTGTVKPERIDLKDSKGQKYDFIKTEKTSYSGMKSGQNPFISSYSIDKIISSNNNDTISYQYQTDGIYSKKINSIYEGVSTTSTYIMGNLETTVIDPIIKTDKAMYTQIVESQKVRYIYFNGGRLTFNLGGRKDLDARYNSLHKLDNIIVESKDGDNYKIIKLIRFYYSYFNPNNVSNVDCYDKIKLCLDSIVEFPSFDISEPRRLIAAFTYYGDKFLPDKKTKSFDFWGYYNGKNNTSEIPLTYYEDNLGIKTIGKADKTPNFECTQIGSIKSIFYPTRGSTTYVWEGNRVNTLEPIYNQRDMKSISVYCSNHPDLDCSKPFLPSQSGDDINIGAQSVKIHSAVDQVICVSYSLYKEDNISNQHNKYDKASIYFDGILLTQQIEQKGNYHYKTISLKANRDYEVVVISNCNNISGGISFSYDKYDPQNAGDLHNYPFGGLRIKDIINSDNTGKIVSKRSYTYLDKSGNSSGYLTNKDQINFESISDSYNLSKNPSGNVLGAISYDYNRRYIVYSKLTSNFKATDYSYEFVQEKDVSDKNIGYTSYQYKTAEDILINSGIPSISNNYLRSLLINKTEYDSQNKRKNIIDYYYSNDGRVYDSKKGFMMDNDTECPFYKELAMFIDLKSIYNPINYEYTTEWFNLDSMVVQNFENSIFPIKNKTLYIYGNIKHMEPTQITELIGQGESQITELIYSGDLDNGIYVDMKNKNMLSYPVDVKKYYSNYKNRKLIDGTHNEYTKNEFDDIVLSKVSKYLRNGCLAELYSYKYNVKSRLLEYTNKQSLVTSIYWDDNNLYPIMIAQNMNYSNLESALLKSSQSSPQLSLLFTNTKITTYTYYPLIGLSSMSLPNGITTYYEYDKLGRLQRIYTMKNNKQNSIKQFTYNLK